MRFDRQYHVGIDRDDLIHALARADFINANLPEGEFPKRWQDVAPYYDLDFDEEITVEEMLERCGVGSRIKPGPTPQGKVTGLSSES